jgi:hypothetical protein
LLEQNDNGRHLVPRRTRAAGSGGLVTIR